LPRVRVQRESSEAAIRDFDSECLAALQRRRTATIYCRMMSKARLLHPCPLPESGEREIPCKLPLRSFSVVVIALAIGSDRAETEVAKFL
jgi:hypothetical protein